MEVALTRPSVKMGTLSVGVIQRVKVVVSHNGDILGESDQQGLFGKGGESHAEQKAWDRAKKETINGGTITFSVDAPICDGCVAWFETTMFKRARTYGATLVVEVNYETFSGSVVVEGTSTVWKQCSESGYYGDKAKEAKVAHSQEVAKHTAEREQKQQRTLDQKKQLPVSKKKSAFEQKGNAKQSSNPDLDAFL